MNKKHLKPNTAPLGLYPIKALPIGEYVRRVDVCTTCDGGGKALIGSCATCGGNGYTKIHDKVYIRGDYCRSWPKAGKYELVEFYDTNHISYKAGSVLVLAGFTF